MKTRLLNILTGVFCLLMSVGCLYSMQMANASQPVIIIMWVAVVCAVWMLTRTVIAAIALRNVKEEDAANTDVTATSDELVEFTVCGKRCQQTKDEILDWLSTKEGRAFADGQAILANVTDLVDGDGRKVAYGLMFVGTQEGKRRMEQEYGEYASVLDFWPIDATGWDALFDDDFYEDETDSRLTELLDKVDQDIAALKEEKNDADQPDLEGVPSDGN